MQYLKNMRSKKGFTLLELIVVIAIIGLLAAIVLASVNSARMKARNGRRIAEVKHYITAIELAYDKYGSYPNDGTANKHACLGNYDDNLCWDAVISNQHGIAAVSKIQEFIPGFPPVEKVDTYYGLLYTTVDTTGNDYWIRYHLEGSSACPTSGTTNPCKYCVIAKARRTVNTGMVTGFRCELQASY